MLKIIILVVIVLMILGGICYFIWWIPSFIMTGKRQTIEEAFTWQSEHYDTSFYGKTEKLAYTVEGWNGYILHAEFLRNPEKTNRYVIISHGYTDNRMGALKYVPIYFELGFNCIIYDLRGHGENAPTVTTYGEREGKDINFLVRDTRKRYPDIEVLGLHGESLGGASTIMSLSEKPEVDFVVSDCAFAGLEDILKDGYRKVHIPIWIVDIADIGTKIRYKTSYRNMRPVRAIEENEIPVLFFHGAEDQLIPPKNSESLAEHTKGYKELVIIPSAAHAESVLKDPEVYKKTVKAFVERLIF
jgi:hypothetical protein